MPFYAAHCLYRASQLCVAALEAANEGTARDAWETVLERLPEADPERASGHLVEVLVAIARPEHAEFCGWALAQLDERGFGKVLGLLAPFAAAVEYWLDGSDAEVLDRLNPEMREVVERIIEHGEADAASGGG